jgi:hypothetical protein
MTTGDAHVQPRRRPQWRGERQAVLVRLPAALGDQLRAEAVRSSRSLSDTAASLIAAGMNGHRA